MTILGCINYIVQFLFIIIYASYDANGKTDRKQWVIKGYGVLYWVLPLSGWFNQYVVLTKDKKIKFTKLFYKL
jgi:hypothetical protein